jgi:hypothetical protein
MDPGGNLGSIIGINYDGNWTHLREDPSDLIGSRGVFIFFRVYPEIHPVPKKQPGTVA